MQRQIVIVPSFCIVRDKDKIQHVLFSARVILLSKHSRAIGKSSAQATSWQMGQNFPCNEACRWSCHWSPHHCAVMLASRLTQRSACIRYHTSGNSKWLEYCCQAGFVWHLKHCELHPFEQEELFARAQRLVMRFPGLTLSKPGAQQQHRDAISVSMVAKTLEAKKKKKGKKQPMQSSNLVWPFGPSHDRICQVQRCWNSVQNSPLQNEENGVEVGKALTCSRRLGTTPRLSPEVFIAHRFSSQAWSF